jgi:hypothetical protein
MAMRSIRWWAPGILADPKPKERPMHKDFVAAFGLAAAGCLLTTTCAAQLALSPSSANTIIQNRRDANSTALQRKAEGDAEGLLRAQAEEPPAATLSLGIGYENGGNGSRSVSAPFAIDYSTGAWYLAVGGGVTSARSQSGHDRGWTDLSITGSYTFTSRDARWQWMPTLSVSIPTGGEVGSKRSIQTADVSVSYKPNREWKLYADVSVAHDNDSIDGVSRYSRGAYVKGEYFWSEATSSSLRLDRSLTSGKRGTTSSALELDFPIPRQPALSAFLILSRTWTQGQRSTGLELDLTYGF